MMTFYSRLLCLRGFHILVAASFWITTLCSQGSLKEEDSWVTQTMQQMSEDQKIGQLFMVRAYSESSPADERILKEFITKYHIGGLCFFQGSPEGQVDMINRFQQISSIPLFMGIDGEWGLGMRFPGQTLSFPRQLMLGAIQDHHLIYEMGREVARHCKRAGINVNFAPSLDIYNNHDNEVIFDRSFGEQKENVTAKGFLYLKGMEDEGILPCIKHFPGHGDTDVDSHFGLPLLPFSKQRLDTLEFYPFRRIMAMGAGAMMVGHLQIPAIDSRPNRPASLSDSLITHIVRRQMLFSGLLFTDAMDMRGITRHFAPGIAEAEAFLAGNDVILLPPQLSKAFAAIRQYLLEGKISRQRLNESVERILRAKYRLGLSKTPYHDPQGLSAYLLRNHSRALKQQLTEAAITLVADQDSMLPIRQIQHLHLATLSLNVSHKTRFQDRIDSYLDAKHYHLMPAQLLSDYQQYKQTLSQFDHVCIAIHTSGRKNDFSKNLPEAVLRLINDVQQNTKVTVILFGQPLLLKRMKSCNSLVLAYDNAPTTQDVAAQSLFGANGFQGKLPISISSQWNAGYGIEKPSLQRLGYSLPEMKGMNSDSLRGIDTILTHAIKQGEIPGAQVLVAKDGRIVYEKNFGTLYSNGPAVHQNSIYDVASVTKALATTLGVMDLVDKGKIHLHHPLRYYIAGIDSTNKAAITIKDLLGHVSGLIPGLAFYKTFEQKESESSDTTLFSRTLDSLHTIAVARSLFLKTAFKDTIFQRILRTPLRNPGKYLYSDLGFLLLQKSFEAQSGTILSTYVSQHFYKPLGLTHTGFLPLQFLPEEWIAPTEFDHSFRKQLLRGYVHDPTAALLGGVAGNAGLFSNAHGMAVLMQLLLNRGSYGGTSYFQPETVDVFTTRHDLSARRGLGFDMKNLQEAGSDQVSPFASTSTFGHNGFTGCAAWADKENGLVFIFQTNKTLSEQKKQANQKTDLRKRVMDIIYKSIETDQSNKK
ncbi:MAG: serine hydrolase [Saprospiraceae bacterium]|nr:serine hydrolase [Saprospiraceae bacterium]